MTPLKTFETVALSTVIKAKKPNRPLDAVAAKSEHQANRIVGQSLSGSPVVVAQRPGRAGGVDFNKLLSGKAYAVAADAVSPIYEKDEKGEKSKIQKLEEGAKAFSSSGFYILSSKEYPAEDILPGYVRFLTSDFTHVLFVPPSSAKGPSVAEVDSDLALELLEQSLEEALSDEKNLLLPYVASANRARKRRIDLAISEAEDQEEQYSGVPSTELPLSLKDGTPFAWVHVSVGEAMEETALTRQVQTVKDGKPLVVTVGAEEAMAKFKGSKAYALIRNALQKGLKAKVSFMEGNVLRSSVMFKKKALNDKDSPSKFGDGPFLRGMGVAWVRAFVTVMYSKHPAFPDKDYDSLHFVCSARQAEMGFNKQGDKWGAPEAILYAAVLDPLH